MKPFTCFTPHAHLGRIQVGEIAGKPCGKIKLQYIIQTQMYRKDRKFGNDIKILTYDFYIAQVDIASVCVDHLLVLCQHIRRADAVVDTFGNILPAFGALCADLHIKVKIGLGVHIGCIVKVHLAAVPLLVALHGDLQILGNVHGRLHRNPLDLPLDADDYPQSRPLVVVRIAGVHSRKIRILGTVPAPGYANGNAGVSCRYADALGVAHAQAIPEHQWVLRKIRCGCSHA